MRHKGKILKKAIGNKSEITGELILALPIVRHPKGRGALRRRTTGNFNRRHVHSITRDGVEYTYHATKGWRARRA